MAEKNNNVDELNRLAQDGRIAEKEDDKEHKKDVQEVAKGKKVIEDVEQIIDVSTLEFYVSENNLFKNMNEPCKFEGINILVGIKEFFATRKVKPKDLEDEIQEYMNRKRLDINQEHKSLFFGDNGVLDVNKTVEKALRNNEKIPLYVKYTVIDNGIKLQEKTDVTLHSKFLAKINEQPDWYFQEVNKNISDRIMNINNIFHEMSFYKNEKMENITTDNGEEIALSKDMSDEFAQTYAKIQIICQKVGVIFARGKSDKENQELLARIIAYYNEILDISTLDFSKMGLSEKDIELVKSGIEETKNTIMYKFNMCSLGLNIDELSADELKSLVGEENYEKLISEEKDSINQSTISAVHKLKDKEEISLENAFISSSEEEHKINIIRQYRILMSLVKNEGPRYTENEDEQIKNDMDKIRERYPDLVRIAEESYDSSNTVEIYSKAIVRNRLLEDLNSIREKGISSSVTYDNSIRFQGEYSKIIPAIIALNMEVRGVHEEDKAARDEALRTLVGIFPNVVSDISEIDYEDERSIDGLKNRLFNEIKNRYAPHFNEGAFDSIKNYEDLAKRLEARYIFKLKGFLINSINGNKKSYEEITKIIEDPTTKKYVREELDAENKEIFENKLYINLINDVVGYTKIKNQNGLKNELEDEFVIKLAAAIQLLEGENEERYEGLGVQKNAIINRNNSLLNEVKSNLADLHPDAFNKDGSVNFEKLNNIILGIIRNNPNVKFLDGFGDFEEYDEKNTKDFFRDLSDDYNGPLPNNALTFISKKIKDSLENEISSENRSLSTKKKTQMDIKKSFKELVDTSRIEDAERVLQVVHYLKEERQEKKAQRFFERYKFKGAADLNTSRFKNAVNNVEEEYRKKVKSLYNDDEKAESSFSNIENHIFDDTVFPGIIREGKRKVANRMLAPILKKYDRNNDELTIEDKATVLLLYMGTEFDIQKEMIESSEKSARNLQGRLKKYLSRINPELIKNGEVDKELLITEFNDYVNTNFVDIDDAIIHAEDVLLEEFVEGLIDKKNDKDLTGIINDTGLRANLKIVDAQTRRDNFHLIQYSLGALNNSLLTRYDLEVTKQDEVELIKGLYLIVDLYDGEKLDRKGLSERNSKVQDLEKDLLEVAKENLKLYFNNTIDKDGKVDKKRLKRNVVEYLRENDPKMAEVLQSGADVTEILKDSLRETDESVIGPVMSNSLEYEIEKTQMVVDEYNANKEQFKYLAMINVLGKMRERFYGEGNGRVDRIALFFDKKCPGLKQKYDSSKYEMEIDDKYVDSVAIICGKSKLQAINEKYFPRGVKGRRFTQIEDIPLEEQKRILQTAIGTIEACKEMGDYKSVTNNNDVIALASNVIKHFAPSAVRNGRIVDEDKVMDCYYNMVLSDGKKSGTYTIDKLRRDSYKKLCLTVVEEFYSDSVDKTKYFEIFDNSKLRSTIKAKRKEDRITNQEMSSVFQEKSEIIHVDEEQAKDVNGDASKTGVVNEEVEIEDNEVAKLLQDKAEELHHDNGINIENEKGVQTQDKVNTQEQAQIRTEENLMEENSPPKVEQQSDELNKSTNGVTVEDMNVGSGEHEMSMVTTESKGFISDVIAKIKNIPNLLKNGINTIKEKLGIGASSSSNTETSSNSTSSSGGVNKTEQDVVKNLTGYGQQNLDLNAARAASQSDNNTKVNDKGNELDVEEIEGK